MRYFISLATAVLILAGCADSHQLVRLNESNSTKLDKNCAVYVAVSKDSRYGDIKYEGSGATTSQVIMAAFAKHIARIESAPTYEPLSINLKKARSDGFSHLVYPMILHWEDRATEWSGTPDKVRVKISLLDVATGQVLDGAIISGESGLATFGGDRPQDLLAEPMDEYVASLF
ncbi:MAG: DUF4823 domain-containing protein [Deltaproteobacteria bacterium]|nr:DUF4823 domain-containing protein [Deltaproteobacteria bacterium]